MPRPAAEVVVDPAHGGLEVGAEVCGGGVEDVEAVALELVALCGKPPMMTSQSLSRTSQSRSRSRRRHRREARGSYLGIELEANLAKDTGVLIALLADFAVLGLEIVNSTLEVRECSILSEVRTAGPSFPCSRGSCVLVESCALRS